MFGRIVRRVLFDDEHFDEPPAITFESPADRPIKSTATGRRWRAEVRVWTK
jgi:hypothetical protein